MVRQRLMLIAGDLWPFRYPRIVIARPRKRLRACGNWRFASGLWIASLRSQ